MTEEQLAEMMQRATDGRDHEWAWYARDVPALVAEIRRLRAQQATPAELYRAFASVHGDILSLEQARQRPPMNP